MPILDRPWHSSASIRAGVITARHPWFDDKLLRLGIAKLSPVEQAQFLVEVQQLLECAPRLRDQAPAAVRRVILDAYFRPLVLDSAPNFEVVVDPQGRLDGMRLDVEDAHLYVEMKAALTKTQSKVSELEREKDQLQTQVESLVRITGQRTDEEKRTTLNACWERFEMRFQLRPGSKPAERRNVFRRVRTVLEKLGWDRRHASIDLADIETALKATQAATETEYAKRAADIKRFFSFLCLPRSRNGLGFVANPALGLHYLGPKALQRKRRNQGLVIAADDPSDLLPKLDPYWRALYATLCYTGLRVAELAALAWIRVDTSNRLIHVLPSLEYAELKSELSERTIKPFKELWPVLESYRSSTSGTGLMFPRPSGKSWFLAVDGQGKVNHLSRDLSRELKRAGIADAKEPGRRARRYWETRMRSIGRADLIPVMGGHTDAVGRDHYTDSKRIVASVAGDDF